FAACSHQLLEQRDGLGLRLRALARELDRQSAVRVLRERIRAVLDEKLDESSKAARRGTVQRRLVRDGTRARYLAPAIVIAEVAEPLLDDEKMRRGLAAPLREIAGVNVGARIDEQPHRLQHAVVGTVAAARDALTEIDAGRSHQR